MRTFITLLFLAISAPFFAQSHTLVKHNGEKLNVNYIKTENNLVYFNSGKDQVPLIYRTYMSEFFNKPTKNSY